jgi:transposase-like protein
MKCPNCSAELRKIGVNVHGASSKAVSYQCPKCDYFEFEQKSAKQVMEELRETPLRIKQKVVKLSSDRLGIYFNSNIIRSLGIKSGEDIYVSVPDKKHILIEL